MEMINAQRNDHIPGVEVAFFRLHISTVENRFNLEDPPWHKGFQVADNTAEVHQTSAFYADITLTLENQDLTADISPEPVLCQTKIWQLNLDPQSQYVFTNPMQSLRRKLVVDEGFTKGRLLGDFKNPSQFGNYPMPQDLEIVFYANWLGTYGDLILHASGFALDGKGYAFAGPSGVGKSTLAGLLKDEPGVTVLGEDQLVLRLLGDTFWIFGTPWHENRSLCSPMGVPLEKLFILEKNGDNSLNQMSPLQGVTNLLQTAFIPYYRPEVVKKILDRLCLLSQAIPINQISYVIGDDVLSRILA
jgi:hypothetical protein